MMKRLVGVLLITLLSGVAVEAANWAKVSEKVERSIVRLQIAVDEYRHGVCTGFVIDNDRNYVLTAAHCKGAEMRADGLWAKAVYLDPENDLMVLFVEELDKPALKPSRKIVRRGDEVGTVGFGYGLERALFRHGYVADPEGFFEGLTDPYLAQDNSWIGGMSGGPVVDRDGKVVGIVKKSDERLGIGRGIGSILKSTLKYWRGNG